LCPWVVDWHDGTCSQVPIIGEVAALHRRGRHGAPEQHAFAIAVPFIAGEEEELVPEHRTAQHAAEVVLHERWFVEAGALPKNVFEFNSLLR